MHQILLGGETDVGEERLLGQGLDGGDAADTNSLKRVRPGVIGEDDPIAGGKLCVADILDEEILDGHFAGAATLDDGEEIGVFLESSGGGIAFEMGGDGEAGVGDETNASRECAYGGDSADQVNYCAGGEDGDGLIDVETAEAGASDGQALAVVTVGAGNFEAGAVGFESAEAFTLAGAV